MLNRRAFFGILAVASLMVGSVKAQTSGGSTYSIFNIGDLEGSVTAAGQSRGGNEVAAPSPDNINSESPALWGDLRNVTLQAGLDFSQYKVSNASSSLYQNHLAIKNFAIGFPWSADYGGGAAFMLRPYSSVNYRTQNIQSAPSLNNDTTNATVTYSGNGGISEAILGTSFRPINAVTLGASVSRYFGSIATHTGLEFSDASLNPAVYDAYDSYFGWGFTLAAVIRPADALRLGVTFETPSTLTKSRTEVSTYTNQGTQVVDTTGTSEGSLDLPARITVGAAFQTGKFIFSAESRMQSWPATQFANARSAARYSIGLERPGDDASGTTGLDKWTYRLGAFYEQQYYTIGNQGINQTGITAGFGIPISPTTRLNVGTTLDAGLEVGMRGQTDLGLTKEMYGRFFVQFALSELWFNRSGR